MSDRLHETQRHRPSGAAAVPSRPRVRQQPPLASLQAAAGNRAVSLAIQRATATQQESRTEDQTQTGLSATDVLVISPVTEPEQQGSRGEAKGKAPEAKKQAAAAKGKAPETRKQAAEAKVSARKQEVADASLERARAADVVWQESGKALEARKNATDARTQKQKHTKDAEAAEQAQKTAGEEQRGHTRDAGEADQAQELAKKRKQKHSDAEKAARDEAAEAQDREKDYTKKAKDAEAAQKKAEDDVVKYTKQAKDAEAAQKKAEDDVVKYRKQAEDAEAEKKAAEAEEAKKAAAGDKALQQAAKAEAEAEELTGADSEVAKWTKIVTAALADAEKAETDRREQEGKAGTANTSKNTAGRDVEKWTTAKETAQLQAKKAQGEAERLLKDALAAATEHAQAEADVATHDKAAKKARTLAQTAGEKAEAHGKTATQARTNAEKSDEEAKKQDGEAAEAQGQAATAAAEQVKARAAETAAKTAHTEAKTEQAEAEQAEADAAKAEAEAKMTPAAKAKKAEKAAKAEKTPEAGEQTEEPGTSDAGKTGKTTMEQLKRPFSSTKIRKWLDPADTVVLRGTAPVGGPLQSHGAQTSNTGLVSSTAQQAQTEAGINVVNDALGALNDGRDAWAGHKGSKETGPKSHQDRKKGKSKAVGLTTNGLMTINDGPKIANSAIKNAGDLGGVAALGDVSGALVMTFSGIFVVRDTYVALRTHKKKDELKKHFTEAAAARSADFRGLLKNLGETTEDLVRECSDLSGSQTGPSEDALDGIQNGRDRLEAHRQELLAHMASLRDYAVGKQTGKEIKRALNAAGNVARTAAGAVVVASAVGAVGGPIGAAVTGGTTAAALGGLAAYKGGKKGAKRYEAVRHPETWARTTDAQEGTESEPREFKKSKDGKGNRKRDATKEAFNVLKPLEQGERQLKAQEMYALAAGPAVPAGKNVPDDVRAKMRDFLKTLNCGPDKHYPEKHNPEKHEQSAEEWENAREEKWANSLNDPERQKEWEDEIAAQLSSA